MNNDVISMAIGIHTGGGGGSTSVGTTFLKRDMKEQEDKNRNIYKQDMARNYGGSTERKGFVTFDNVTYDLKSFVNYHTLHSHTPVTGYTTMSGRVNTPTAHDFTLNGKPWKAYAEVSGALTRVSFFGHITITADYSEAKSLGSLNNSDPEELGISIMSGEFGFPSIHLHPPAGQIEYLYNGHTYGLPIGSGPSDNDYDHADSGYFNVIVDDKYIWLYRQMPGKPREEMQFDKMTYKRLK